MKKITHRYKLSKKKLPKPLIVNDDVVFSPDFFNASYEFADVISDFVETNPRITNLLSMGCGSGVDFWSLVHNKKIDISKLKLTLCDIDKNAVKNSKLNFDDIKCFSKKFIQSDLFENVTDKYDLICYNAPFFNHIPHKNEKYPAHVRHDLDFKNLNIFVSTVAQYLTENGVLVITSSDFNNVYMSQNIKNNNFKLMGGDVCRVNTHLGKILPEDLCFNVYINIYKL